MNYRLIILIAALSVVGCSKSDTPNTTTTPDYELSTTSIGFSAEESVTRGSIADKFYNGSTMGIVAYYLPSGEEDMPTTTPNFMYNQKVDYDGTYWTYSPIMYWPVSGYINFCAYSPYVSSSPLSGIDEEGYPKIYFTPATDAANQVDFMTAQTSGTYNENGKSGINLKFDHQLSQVYFSGKYESTTEYEIKVTQIELKGVKTAEYGQFIEDGFIWSTEFSDDETTYSNSNMSGTALAKSGAKDDEGNDLPFTQATASQNGYMFLYPQTFADQQVSIILYFTMTSGTITSSANVEIPVGAHEYVKSKTTNYRVTLEIDNFVATGVASAVSENWKSGSDIFDSSQDIE